MPNVNWLLKSFLLLHAREGIRIVHMHAFRPVFLYKVSEQRNIFA